VRRKGRTLKRKYRSRETRAEVEGVSGPSGTYKNTPTLGVPGAILGDPDTAVLFNGTNEYARIGPLDQEDMIAGNRLTVEAWVKPTAASTDYTIVAGPYSTGLDAGAFYLSLALSGGTLKVNGGPRFTDLSSGAAQGATTVTVGAWHHVAFTWDGGDTKVYLDGVLEKTSSFGGKVLAQGNANEYLYIATDNIGAGVNLLFDGAIDEVAIYEKALTAATILAHYNAGANRGFGEQLTGARIAAIASSPLWSTAGIDAGVFVMQPTMELGQGKLDEIVEAANAELPRSLFYFDGNGDPIYRDFDFLDGRTTDLTLGDSGAELAYMGLEPIYDNEVYNTVIGSTDGGTAVTATDAQSILDRKTKTRDADVGLPLRDDDDVLTIVSAIASEWARPAQRFASVTTVGRDAGHVSHILRRGIGNRVRVRRRGEGGTPIDRQTVILGYRKRMDQNRILSCIWNMARGFNATPPHGGWHLGVPGFSELGTTTKLG
jgi:hypothetical protein